MSSAATPAAIEQRRLAALHSLALLDSAPAAEYDAIVELAAQLLDMPGAYIALMDSDRQWYKARHHIDAADLPREMAFCNHVIMGDAEVVVDDLSRDARFATNPLVTGDPGFRFYAGTPIRLAHDDGERLAIGTLCVVDHRPRALDDAGRQALRHLAALAEALVEARAAARRAHEMAVLAEAQSAALARQDRIFREAERMALIGSWRLDLADDTVTWSDGVYRIHELPVGEMPLLSTALDHYPAQARARVSAALATAIDTAAPFDFEEDFFTATGAKRRVRSRGEVEVVDGTPAALIGVFQDITDHHMIAQTLRRSADFDELTAIPNRASFNRTVAAAIDAAQTGGTPLLLALIDLDGFKAINDTLGHLAGDDVLRIFARRLQAPWLRQSFAARLGGDEFALLVDDPMLARDPTALTARLQAELCLPVTVAGLTIAASGTVGTAMLARHDTLRDLMHAADTDLYAAKRRRIGTPRRRERRDAA